MKGQIIFERGEHKLDRCLYIGSMRVVGHRKSVVFSAFSTFYNDVLNLLVRNGLKKFHLARPAPVREVSLSFYEGADKGRDRG